MAEERGSTLTTAGEAIRRPVAASPASVGTNLRIPAELTLARILIIDDEIRTIVVLRDLLERAGFLQLVPCTDPTTGLRQFDSFKPDIILLDLQMPVLDGFGMLERFAALIPEGEYLPIIVITGDGSSANKRRALAAGAKDFITKPFDSTEVLLRITNLLKMRFLHLQLQDQARWLEQRVVERTQALEEVHIEVCGRLARAAEFRDDTTGEHTKRVGRLARTLAERIGADLHLASLIEHAAPLHDVGKIAIPDVILLKEGSLTPEEFEVIKTHTTIGAKILSGGQSDLLQMAEQVARSHHERWDGSGYPHGLVGDAIPLPARIVGLVDFFDALTHARPYRAAWPVDQVVAEIAAQAGRHFDPELVEKFVGLSHPELL